MYYMLQEMDSLGYTMYTFDTLDDILSFAKKHFGYLKQYNYELSDSLLNAWLNGDA